MDTVLIFKWTVSRGRDSYGYNICSLWVNGKKVASCNGGGYDMKGTSLGHFIERNYADRLRESIKERFYGLTFHDPDYDPGKAVVPGADGRTVEEREKTGESLGLERYQAFYYGASNTPDEKHRVPSINGACGWSSVERIMNAIGLRLKFVHNSKNKSIWQMIDERG